MKSHKIPFIILAGLLVLPLGASKDKVITSRWTAAPVAVDGQTTEWAPEEIVAEESVGAKIAVRNDASHVYVMLSLDDPQFQSTAEQTGITFWINPAMKTKKVHGIKFYRKTITADELIQLIKSRGQELFAEKEAELKAQPQYLHFACDPVNKKGEIVPRPGQAETATYRLSRVQQAMVYEFVIPLALLDDPENEVKVDPAKPFKFGVEWGGVTEEIKQMRLAQFEGGADMSGGGLGEYSTEDYLAARQSGPQVYSFWVDLRLAPGK
ncbi:MAG: hypothetical protein NTW38_08345 [Candidatus Aminicenantes bacterium]|nr:hypothetical protein [Candidatus Aminicenantes bacterium]